MLVLGASLTALLHSSVAQVICDNNYPFVLAYVAMFAGDLPTEKECKVGKGCVCMCNLTSGTQKIVQSSRLCCASGCTALGQFSLSPPTLAFEGRCRGHGVVAERITCMTWIAF